MSRHSIGSIVVRHNPVTQWEQFEETLLPGVFLDPEPEHRDIGGFYAMKYRLIPESLEHALDYLHHGIQREVIAYNTAGKIDWEGYINYVIVDTGTVRKKATLSNKFNTAWARYDPGTGVTTSTLKTVAASVARYGTIEKVFSIETTSSDVADQAVEAQLRWNAYPAPVADKIIPYGSLYETGVQVEIGCLGWWHTLDYRTYDQSVSSGDVNLSALISTIIAAKGQFVDSTYIEENTTQVEQKIEGNRKVRSIVENFAGYGDSLYRRWITGVRENREFYFMAGAQTQ